MPKPQVQQGGLNDFTLASGFALGYRNREDKTALPPGVLVEGSQNVLTNTARRIAVRKGYELDGQSSAVIAPISSSFDWNMRRGDRNLRAGFKTGAVDGKLQYRYVATAAGQSWNGNIFTLGQVFWIDLKTALTSVGFNFATFWDFSSELKDFLLFVDGSSNIYEWSGGITTFASAAAGPNTITKQGATTWAEENFYNLTAGRAITINGVDYTYTGGEGTTTLTGVLPDPTLAAHPVGSVVHQKVITTANSAMTNIPATFKNSLIENLRNQIYIGSLIDNSVYISKVNNYKNFTFTVPVRIVGEGARVTLDAPPVAFKPQEDKMYIGAGKDQWYETQFQLSLDLSAEAFNIIRLKTTSQQGTQSQAMTTKIKNDVAFVSFEPIVNTLGRVDNVVLTPQVKDVSFPIINDMNGYDFTDASIAYYRNFIYLAVPKHNLVRMYNMTDPQNPYWEAPQILPVSRFAVIGGELYGHSYFVGETYKLFSGYNDNGKSMQAIARFSFDNYGTRSSSKNYNQLYTEGYISSNTTLTLTVQKDIDGCATTASYNITGTSSFVCTPSNDASLGKTSLGKKGLGTTSTVISADALPPKFRWIRTFPPKYFYEDQISYSSTGTDQRWEVLAFGPQILPDRDQNNAITD